MSPYCISNRSLLRPLPLDRTSFLLCQLNCNSIFARLSELRLYLYSKKPEVVCLCETWAHTSEPRFNGYQAVWQHRQGRAGGGLCVLVRNDVPFSVNMLVPFPRAKLEVVSVRVFSSLGLVDVVNIYNPCLDVSLAELTHLSSQLCPLNIIIGDFNAHSPMWDERGRSNYSGTSLESFLDLNCHGLLNPYYTPTYVNGRTGTTSCLDLCLPVLPLLSRGSMRVGADVGSDHLPIECFFGLSLQKADGGAPSRWLLKHADWPAWLAELSNSNFTCVVPTSADALSSDVCSRLLAACQSHVPCSSNGVRVHRNTPWWDSECSKAVARRRQARRTLSVSPTLSNLIAFKKFSAIAKHLILKKKRDSWRNYVASLSMDTPPAKVWRTIRSINGSSSARAVLPVGGPEAPLALKAALLLEHFVPPYFPTLSDHDRLIQSVVLSIRGSTIVETPYNVPLGNAELRRSLVALTNSSPGHDTVLNAFLKRLPPTFLEQLLYVFNVSYMTGVVPVEWKMGIICPIPKPGKDPLAVTGYRPIALLSCVGKLMERILKVRLEHFLESSGVFSCWQTGFRRGRSTADALVLLRHHISGALADGSFCLAVYLDLAQAYDGVWHDGLLYKLRSVKCDVRTLQWLESYLRGRSVRVRVGSLLSDSRPLLCGLPQGAVLSPLLFNVMLSDLPQCPRVKVISYADDISLICTGRTVFEVQHRMQEFLNSLSDWFLRWHFKVNSSKSSFQVFTRRRRVPGLTLMLSGRQLQRVSEQRVLGVLFDAPRLTLAPHVRRVRVECLRRLNVLRALSGLRWGSSRCLLRRVYIAFIRSKILYGQEIYPDFPAAILNPLSVVQNSAIRCILGARKTSPVVSLEVESFLMPLGIYFAFSYLKWCLRQSCGPGGPTELAEVVQLFSSPPVGCFSERRARLARLAGVANLRGTHCSFLSPVLPCADFQSLISVSSPDLALPSTIAVNDQHNMFLDSHYPSYVTIYTDGSRLDTGSVAAALYVPSLSRSVSWRLHPSHSVMGAELFAVLQALRLIRDDPRLQTPNIVILSDCLSALYVLLDIVKPRYRAFYVEIHSLMLYFTGRVILQWVPGHCGVDGNEVADGSASLGHNNDRSVLTTLHYEELLPVLREAFFRSWVAHWHRRVLQTGKGAHLRGLLAEPCHRSCLSGVSRTLQCAVARLRIGHVGVASHLFRFNLADSPLCTTCNVDETIVHFLLECSRYVEARRVLRRKFESLSVPLTLSNLLGCGEGSVSLRHQMLRALCSYLVATGRAALL